MRLGTVWRFAIKELFQKRVCPIINRANLKARNFLTDQSERKQILGLLVGHSCVVRRTITGKSSNV